MFLILEKSEAPVIKKMFLKKKECIAITKLNSQINLIPLCSLGDKKKKLCVAEHKNTNYDIIVTRLTH